MIVGGMRPPVRVLSEPVERRIEEVAAGGGRPDAARASIPRRVGYAGAGRLVILVGGDRRPGRRH
jgi:hypothetical protein